VTTPRTPRAVRAVLALLGEGWTWEGLTQRGHSRFRHRATGALLVAAPRSGCPRVLLNIQTDARRAIAQAREGRRA
jgi:hypothetical protein